MPFTRTDLTPLADARSVDASGDTVTALGVNASAIPSAPTRLQLNDVGSGLLDSAANAMYFADADGSKPLVLQQRSAGQTANLFELQAPTGSLLAAFGAGGQFGIGTAPVSTSQVILVTGSTSRKGLTITRAASQSANIIEVNDSNGTTNMVAVNGGGCLRLYKGLSLASQAFTQNGGTIGTITGQAAVFVRVIGSGGGTLNLPSSGFMDGMVAIVKNAGTASITLSGNGLNIDGSASVSIAANAALSLRYDSGLSLWDTF